jgi:SAM-dependent methyltransferase
LLELIDGWGSAVWRGGPVLVPGCGTGHDVRALADFGVPTHGLDLSETAVKRARSFPCADAASYEVGDFLDPAWRAGRSFAAIWEHTCFCAIHPCRRADYARAAAEVLPAGGFLAGVFYLRPFDPGESGQGPPFGVSVEELEKTFLPWFERVDGRVPRRAYPGREGREWLGVFRKLPHARVAGETGCV